jgi:hypothetical protein
MGPATSRLCSGDLPWRPTMPRSEASVVLCRAIRTGSRQRISSLRRRQFSHATGVAYLFHLVRNHALIDGNKRVALARSILFFKINRLPFSITEEEAIEPTLAAASGQMDKGVVTGYFQRPRKFPTIDRTKAQSPPTRTETSPISRCFPGLVDARRSPSHFSSDKMFRHTASCFCIDPKN